MKRAVLFIIMLMLCAARAEEAQTARGEVFTMDTYVNILCTGSRAQEAVNACTQELLRLNDMLSTGEYDSETAVINRNGSGYVSEDTLAILEKALEIHGSTRGAFDITVYPLMELWGFTTGSCAVPRDEDILSVLERVDSDRVSADSETAFVTVGAGQGIDLGGIAKGFASDRVMSIFSEYGVTSGYVTLGGNVQVYGTKADGSLWKIGIQDPGDSGAVIGAVKVRDKAVITSGAYQRYFTDEETGEVYHHIIDPATGYPSESDLVSVTVISSSGMLADALSTSCFIMGSEGALEYWREYGDDFELVLMTRDGGIYVTEGMAEAFTCYYPCSVCSR